MRETQTHRPAESFVCSSVLLACLQDCFLVESPKVQHIKGCPEPLVSNYPFLKVLALDLGAGLGSGALSLCLSISTLSSCSHAVVALLYPFSWQHTFIPVLPASMIDIVCCPTPFLVGLLSSSLPKLKELPVEEALMVNLGSDRFIRQMDDEDTLLPRKLQAALEQALERKNELISQDSDSDSDDECNTLNGLVSEVFIRFFVETVGHYSLFLTHSEKGERAFQREAFRKSVASKSIRRFLEVFMESQMFAGFIQDRELRKCRAKGLFEQRVEQYLEELPDTEQSGMNKFLRGLGNKMKFLHKKN